MLKFSLLDESKMLTLSAKHLKDETFEMLQNLEDSDTEFNDFIAYAANNDKSAVIIKLYPGESIENGKDPYADVQYRDLKRLLLFATDLGCDVLCIDVIADPLPYLPVYDSE